MGGEENEDLFILSSPGDTHSQLGDDFSILFFIKLKNRVSFAAIEAKTYFGEIQSKNNVLFPRAVFLASALTLTAKCKVKEIGLYVYNFFQDLEFDLDPILIFYAAKRLDNN